MKPSVRKKERPLRSARQPRPKRPVVPAPRDRLFEALREELGL